MATRRELLLGMTSMFLIPGCDPFELFGQQAEKFERVEWRINQEGKIPVESIEAIDTNYLATLMQDLQKERGDKNNGVNSIVSGLRLIRKVDGFASAFQIDESGYYVTARHTVTTKESLGTKPHETPIVLSDPVGGTIDLVTSLIIDEKDDLAIIYAPTKRQRKAANNIQINLSPPQNNAKLSMIGFIVDGNLDLWRGTVWGQVDTTFDLDNSSYSRGAIAVSGMKPFGGSSGGPVWDEQGRIVGVESSFYPIDTSSRREYKGAVITTLSKLTQMPSETVYVLKDGIKYTPLVKESGN